MNIFKLIKKYPITAFFSITAFFIWASLALNISGKFPAFGEYPIRINGNLVAVFRTRQTLINWIPNIMAFTILGIISGRNSVKRLIVRFFKFHIGIVLWVKIAAIPFLITVAVVFIYFLTGGDIQVAPVELLLAVFFVRFLFSMSTESVGGEAGWRGFVLEHLQSRFHPLKASLIVGFLWGLCHIPILTIRGFNGAEFVYFLLIVMNLSVFFSWVYNRSNASLAAVCFVHCLFNALDATVSRSFVAVMDRESYLSLFALVILIVGVCIVIFTKTRLGYQKLSEQR